jgi:hypothetical protein
MLPFKLDIGGASARTRRGLATGMGASLGLHWASLAAQPTNFDIGIGGFVSGLDAPRSTRGMDVNDHFVQLGAYLEVGHTLTTGRHLRTWASGRGEYLSTEVFGPEHNGFGVSGRLTGELFTSGTSSSPGYRHGTLAIGVYAEVAARDSGMDGATLSTSLGLTLRTPFVLAL